MPAGKIFSITWKMKYNLRPHLIKVLKKLKKKDLVSHNSLLKKIKEIVHSEPEHYKPLSHDMKNLKRVHISKSYVLVFSYDKRSKSLTFEDYDHHDNIYKKYH